MPTATWAQSLADTNPWTSLDKVEQAERFNPLHPRLVQREAELAAQVGDWPRVEKAFVREVQLNPEHYISYLFLAQFYERRGQPEKALSFYEKAVKHNPLEPALKKNISRLQEQAKSR